MSKKKLIFGLLFLLVMALGAAGCAGDTSPYPGFDRGGYKVSVRFDSNGGMFADTSNVNIVDVYSLNDLKTDGEGRKVLKLLEPGSPARGEGQEVSTPSNTGRFLAGWYARRSPRVSESGEPLDENGVPVSVSGKSQGYVYAEPWDFSNDTLKLDTDREYTSGECVLTLYAAWVPYFTYTFYAPPPAQEESPAAIGSYEFNPLIQTGELRLPEWNAETGRLDLYDFPTVENKTFTAAYKDAAMQQAWTQSVTHSGAVDVEKGIGVGTDVPVYTSWQDGTWFRISTAEQFYDNGRTDGCYEILDDLDFTDVPWPAGLARGQFTGKILGNGHSFSNVSVNQSDISQINGGLFSQITESAELRDVAFVDAVYTLSAGSRMAGAQFGLFAGSISGSAVLDRVRVSGRLEVGSIYVSPASGFEAYSIGLLSGNLITHGISLSQITCVSAAVQSGTDGSGNPIYRYPVKVDVNRDGSVTVSENEAPDTDPNPVS